MTYYVVYHGRVPGVYEDWEDCRRQVHRFSGNSYKGYTTLEEAETRYANFRAGQRREMWRTPFIVMMLVATVSLVYYVIVV
jgi:ribonuclease HI